MRAYARAAEPAETAGGLDGVDSVSMLPLVRPMWRRRSRA